MRNLKNSYLFLLALIIGVEISIGAFLAPVLFFPAKYIGEGVLSLFQSGQLMTQVFLKYNTLLIAVCLVSIIYELINLIKNKEDSFNFKFSAFMLSFIVLGLASSFAFYFTPYIVNAQSLGELATATNDFARIHKASEIVMKIMIIAQTILFFVRARS
ncbi:DUF4149 domain-containing protein [Campylobacter hyointestinalis]|uniref:DUF4149 domain-containing protein n=1 Tax=Campylobacter hyointestinalis subsp. lawsonii TaxID=91353 RepID=A0AAV6EII0_CAMHY|nr:DUF4149 domain-containing protein [Campylobacter hyointestinalis]KAB0613246.1 DUF4149 domain-containing protein [Campylobacter hyointestinalis subsp. lawsonii]QKF69164.1 DUF4149 domain-containing membrane protein [Campylobacter hyointestinalis subsp. lawsonii]RAZ29644.1 DUF4149 domain-containing protein [Campylobacter hyointestinalis subsp. lawsonii]RAZ48560.1 DUF4149 domain-containing protein [Campylobacter hyointestinalis subsp. lawsonii]